MTSGLRVYVCDDYEIPRAGVSLILEDRKITVVGRGTAISAMNQVPALKPTVVIIRDSLDHLSAMRSICRKSPAIAFVMLNGSGAVSTMDALAAGVRGVADVAVSIDSLVLALRTVADGHMWIDDQSATGMRDRVVNGPPGGPLDDLTHIEVQVLEQLAEGKTNAQIAAALFIAVKTAKNYVSRILTKLNVSSRTQAALVYQALPEDVRANATMRV